MRGFSLKRLNATFVKLVYSPPEEPKLRWVQFIRNLFAKTDGRLAFVLGMFSSILVIIYFFYNFIITQTPMRMAKPSAALIQNLPLWARIKSLPLPIPRNGEIIAISLILFVAIAFFFYAFAVLLTWGRRGNFLSISTVLISAAVFFLISVWSFPNVNRNIFNYMLRGRTAAIYNSNPYYVPAERFSEDPIYRYANPKHTEKPGGKLPAWMLINVSVAKLAGNEPVKMLLFYRFTFFTFSILNLILIAAILRRLYPRFMLSGILLYGWNPIVIIYGQSKIDTVMVFYLLLGSYLLVRNRNLIAVASLTLSALTKLVTLPLIAIYWLRELALRRWRGLLITSVILGVTAFAVYVPFWYGPGIILQHIGLVSAGGATASGFSKAFLRVGFCLLIVWVAYTQNGTTPMLFRGWAIVMLYFSFFITKVGSADYLMTLLWLASLSCDFRIVWLTIAITFSSFMLNIWHTNSSGLFPLPDLFSLPRLLIYLVIPLLVFICMTIVLFWKRLTGQHDSKRVSGEYFIQRP